MSKLYISWDQVQRDVRRLASQLLPADRWHGIIAVSRGGLVPASILARELGIRYVDTVCISSYHDHEKQGQLQVLKAADTDGEGFIVVDDLVDTGNTARKIRELYPKARFVSVYAKPAGKALVDEFVTEVGQDVWIELPWDMALCFVPPVVEGGFKSKAK